MTGWPKGRNSLPGGQDRWWALGTALSALVLYVRTMPPTIATVFDDSLEFVLVAWRWAIPHPTGYPLYALLIGLAARLVPFGEVAWRVSLISALAGAATVGLVVILGRRLGLSRPAALWAAMTLAMAETFWAQARVAEVYTLHLLLVTLLLLALAERPRPNWTLAALSTGLGLAHHRTILLWAPSLLLEAVWSSSSRAGLRESWRRLLLLGALPLVFYAYLPLRGHVGSLDGAYQNTPSGVLQWVMGSAYSVFLTDNPLGQIRGPEFYAAFLQRELSPLATALALLGTVWIRRRPRVVSALAVGAVTNALFAIGYRVGDPEVFWLPTVLVTALFSGFGLQVVAERLVQDRWSADRIALVALAVMVPLHLPRWAETFRQVDLSRAWEAAAFAQDALTQPLPERAVVIGILGEMTLLRYWQEVHGLRPDVKTVAADTELKRLAAVETALGRGQPVLLTRPLPGAEQWALDAVGPLIAVDATWPEAAEGDAELYPVTDGLWVRGRVAPLSGPGPARQRVQLLWLVERPPEDALKVSVRLRDERETWLAQVDCQPVHDAYPSTAWKPGEQIVDAVDVPALPDGRSLEIVIYRADDGSAVASFVLPAVKPSRPPYDAASGTCAPAYRLR
ncbi:MAG: DUF2723 domain-containing protein [Ardenticatenia bacterium]|nr:DUF2723 domain-containing protein [Ardenticatenia bacterium]